MHLVKISVRLSLSARISLLLLVAILSLVSSSSLTSSATASSSIDNEGTTTGSGTSTATTNNISNDTSLNVTTSTIELGEKPFEVGRHRVVSLTNGTGQQKLTFEGNTTITTLSPGSAEPITTRDEGEGILTLLPWGGGILREEIHMNATQGGGRETATADITEYFVDESPTSISLVYFSTNSTGLLAALNNVVAVSIDEQQQNGDVVSRGFEWKHSNSE